MVGSLCVTLLHQSAQMPIIHFVVLMAELKKTSRRSPHAGVPHAVVYRHDPGLAPVDFQLASPPFHFLSGLKHATSLTSRNPSYNVFLHQIGSDGPS